MSNVNAAVFLAFVDSGDFRLLVATASASSLVGPGAVGSFQGGAGGRRFGGCLGGHPGGLDNDMLKGL